MYQNDIQKVNDKMNVYDLIPKLIRAAVVNDKKTVETISIMIGRKLKKEYPELSTEIMQIASNSSVGADAFRSIAMEPSPVDKESRNQLVRIEEAITIDSPILNLDIENQLSDFLKERGMLERFLEENILPPNSILLTGKPGVGKTYIAKWLSYKLNMPLVTLDLASAISSYLGRSGQNIKSIFEFAKTHNVILFLDELDAIAKRRDDMGDLGELKRLVNVLLKELEECPVTCVIIGATNHPEMLDSAIWRRFDRSIEVLMPGKDERRALIIRSLGPKIKLISEQNIEFIINNTEHVSASEICKLCEHIKRQILMNETISPDLCALKECCRNIVIRSKEDKIQICKRIRDDFPKLSVRDISDITSIPSASVSRYIKE